MVEEAPDEILREVYINAEPELVFRFLIDPQKMLSWIGKTAELDPRPGGVFRVDVNGRDVVRGEFVEVVPPRRVVFTWGWEGSGTRVPPGSTTVEITLEPQGPGTLLRLRHRGLRGADRDRHAFGWKHYVTRLVTVAEGGNPGPDPLGTPDTVHGRDPC